MFKTLSNAWKVQDIRKKMIFTLYMILIFRLGMALPVPYISREAVQAIYNGNQGQILQFLNLLTGGGLDSLSVFALGVGPYITASIVIQLLTFAIPALEEISKEGEEGKKKIQRYTRYLGLVLAIVQAYAYVNGIFRSAIVSGTGPWQKTIVMLALVAGAMFIVWIGDLIGEKGIGNGLSLIIFLGIVARIPDQVITWVRATIQAPSFLIRLIPTIIIILATIVFVVILTEGERKIPVQYAKRVVGRKMYGGQSTHIPLKVNMAGVLPVIFASSLLQLPQTLALLFGGGVQKFVTKYMSFGGTVGTIVYLILQVVLIIAFAFFYNSIQFNPIEYSKNLQQYGGFIPGIRPGRPTSEYLGNITNKVTLIGAIGLAILAVIPTIVTTALKMHMVLAGTSVIIAVGVILETIRQIEAMMQMRHYKGFLNK